MGYSELEACLLAFRDTFNANNQVKKIVSGWDRTLLIEATDTEAVLLVVVQDRLVAEIKPGTAGENEAGLIHLQASEENLRKIFSGDYNPANALIDGELAVFSTEKDKIKLEAISIVIWGM